MKIVKCISVIAVIAMMASCGGGSGSSSSGKKLASNDVFGDLPNLIYQHNNQDAELKDEAKKKQEGLPFNESGLKKAKEIDDKYSAKRKAADEKFFADVEKLKPSLVGKDIPFEVEDGLPYEIISYKIADVGQYGGVSYEITFKILDAQAITTNWSNEYRMPGCFIDKDGNEMEKAGGGCGVVISKEEHVDGAILTQQGVLTTFVFPEKYVNFAKNRFTVKSNNL